MVQSPRREDAKWENTGLRAGKTETDTQQRKSGRLDARKPTASRGLWSHVLTKGTPRASWRAAWGRKLPLLERIFHVTLKLLFMPTFTLTTWKLKILFELTFDQIQITARIIYYFFYQGPPQTCLSPNSSGIFPGGNCSYFQNILKHS